MFIEEKNYAFDRKCEKNDRENEKRRAKVETKY